LAPDSVMLVSSRNMSVQPTPAPADSPPTSLGGTAVQVTDARGQPKPAPLFYVSAGQVIYAVPSALATGPGTVSVYRDGFLVAQGNVQIADVAPALFTANSTGSGVAAAFYIQGSGGVFGDPQLVFQCSGAPGSCVAIPIDLGTSTVQTTLFLFGTGIRGASSVTVTVGGESVPAQLATSCCLMGLDEVTLSVPHSLAGKGLVNVLLTANGQAANTVQVSFK